MMLFYMLACIMFMIIVANFLAQAIPAVPKSFWQIAGGIVLAILPGLNNYELELNPEWFMMLIIAPLLFYEGQKTNARLISSNFSAIVGLAGWLALWTVLVLVGVGHFVVGWTFPLALALAAIVTPTDATALESVTEGRLLPSGIKRALSLESMFNDATGLVILELALLWLDTGHFSIVGGFKEFMIVALGGAIWGGIAGAIFIYIRQHLLKGQFDDTAAHIMFYFLAPIMIYGLAEHFGVSGIIAVVVTGIMSNEEKHHTQFMSSQLSHLSNQLTDIVSQILNGFVFVLLGSSLVRVFKVYMIQPVQSWLGLIGIGVLIYVAMTVFRYMVAVKADEHGSFEKMFVEKRRDGVIFALGGVHGAVTMAMALSLPLTLAQSTVFPSRDAMLLVASVVIILSLLIPLLVFPRILPVVEPDYDLAELHEAHIKMINTGMAQVEQTDATTNVKRRVIAQLQDQLGYGDDQLDREIWERAQRKLETMTNSAIEDVITSGTASNELMVFYRRLQASRDQRWTFRRKNFSMWFGILERYIINLVSRNKQSRLRHYEQMMKRRQKKLYRKIEQMALNDADKAAIVARIEQRTAAFERQKKQLSMQSHDELKSRFEKGIARQRDMFEELQAIINPVIDNYLQQLAQDDEDPRYIAAVHDAAARMKDRVRDKQRSTEGENEILLTALQAELSFVQQGRTKGEFSRPLAKVLYDEVTSAQALVLAMDSEEE